MHEELTDIFGSDGEHIGTVKRSEAELGNHHIQNVLIFVFDSLGHIWIQKRPERKTFGGLWDVSACGAVKSGESFLEAAQREQLEEMGFASELLQAGDTFDHEIPSNDGLGKRKMRTTLFVSVSDEVPVITEEVDDFTSVPYKELRQNAVENPESFVPMFVFEIDKAIAFYECTFLKSE
jgi:isopentenyldiphosphate isomerase